MQTILAFDAFADNLSLLSDDGEMDWPAMAVTFDYIFHPPEPDVGIFHNQLDVQRIRYRFGDADFDDELDFCSAVYAAIADDIYENEDEVIQKINEQMTTWYGGLDEIADA